VTALNEPDQTCTNTVIKSLYLTAIIHRGCAVKREWRSWGSLGENMVYGGGEAGFPYFDFEILQVPPSHDAWTVGDELCVFVEFSRGNSLYGVTTQ
jgi:hypothetical protein